MLYSELQVQRKEPELFLGVVALHGYRNFEVAKLGKLHRCRLCIDPPSVLATKIARPGALRSMDTTSILKARDIVLVWRADFSRSAQYLHWEIRLGLLGIC